MMLPSAAECHSNKETQLRNHCEGRLLNSSTTVSMTTGPRPVCIVVGHCIFNYSPPVT